MQFDSPPLFPRPDGTVAETGTPARLLRWSLHPDAGTNAFSRTEFDDLAGEFPRFDERRAGLPYRYGAIAARTRYGTVQDSIAWYDLVGGRCALYTMPEGDGMSEPVFVPPLPDAAEGDGWLLALAYRAAENRNDLLVPDTGAIGRGPVASVELAHRVPFGFHGNFVPSDVQL